MGYKKGINRNQKVLFPESLDDYIEESNAVRFIDSFVDSLDMKKLGFKYALPKATGRPPYDPADMLKLYIYGYLNKIRSSRNLERETHRNIEVMWLLRKLTPDFKTISDFRKDNKKAIKTVSKMFILLCKKMDLFGKELIAIDGSKFKAVNSKKRNFNKKNLTERINNIDKSIDEYLSELETSEEESKKVEEDTDNKITEEKKEKIEKRLKELQDRKNKYEESLKEMEEKGKMKYH